jgi:hypothetical protein
MHDSFDICRINIIIIFWVENLFLVGFRSELLFSILVSMLQLIKIVVRARQEREVARPRVGENYHSPKRGSITMPWSRQHLVVVV